MDNIYATLITIGDELLIGQVIDTNSAFMAQELNKIGVLVKRRIAVGDNKPDILEALDDAAASSQIILITGGLGPTADDITKPLLCEYFGGRMVTDADALQNVKGIFARLNRPMIERNLLQAEVPDVCTVIQNKRGTAPGMWFSREGRIFVSMPGVPHEMKGMMTGYVLPHLQQEFAMPHIMHRTLLTAGVGESFLADLVNGWETQLPPFIKLAYLPNFGMVRLRLTGVGDDEQELKTVIDAEFHKVQQLVKEWLVTTEDEPMEAVVGKLLKAGGQTLGTAESCTGGYIAHLITSMPGASSFFTGSVVSYSNAVKQEVLGVSSKTLEAYGAVSEQVVAEMVTGALAQLKTDYAIAVSGIMGPDGGSPEKPVGTVWIAVGDKNETMARRYHFRFDRRRNIELTATNALNQLRQFILAGPGE